jgi:hypothetical protein
MGSPLPGMGGMLYSDVVIQDFRAGNDDTYDYGGYDHDDCEATRHFFGTICGGIHETLGDCAQSVGVFLADVLIRSCTPCIDDHVDHALEGQPITAAAEFEEHTTDDDDDDDKVPEKYDDHDASTESSRVHSWVRWLNPYTYTTVPSDAPVGDAVPKPTPERRPVARPFATTVGGGEMDQWERGGVYDDVGNAAMGSAYTMTNVLAVVEDNSSSQSSRKKNRSSPSVTGKNTRM